MAEHSSRVSIIRDGRNVESGTLTQLRHLSHTTLEATLDRAPDQADIAALPGVSGVVVSGTHVTCAVESGYLGAVLQHLGTFGIHSLTSAPPTLEELFMEQYRVPAATP